jgi:predicted ATPase/DNA-binding winged helix-turn-helix (wHTH) protein
MGSAEVTSNPARGTLRFDRFTLDLAQRQVTEEGVPLDLGARAFDLLRTLAQSPGKVLTKAELFAAAWPGVTVDENNLQVQVSALRKVLGAKLIATVPGRGYQFTAAVTQEGDHGTAPTSAPRLFGRAGDVAQLTALLATNRLVTMMGPAGVGKTALARALARQAPDRFKDLIVFVELAPITDPALVPAALAGALGIKLQSGLAADQIAAHIGTASQLVILDNCEHQIAAVATLVENILRAAPAVHILATSQARLSLAEEAVYALAPLPTPADVTLYSVEQSPAAGLFAARIAEAAPGFELTNTNAADVSDICARLDGIPLALELAAARVSLLGVEGVRARLGHRLKLLTKGQRGAAERHSTLRAALDWSYSLLPPSEQFVFRCLSVFRGGFTVNDVQAVAINDTVDQWEALDALSALIDRSLVARRPITDPAAEPRFTLLETMAEFAAEALALAGETQAAHARQAAHFTALAIAVGARSPDGNNRINRDYTPFDLNQDNLRACLDWSLAHDLPQAFRLVDCLGVYWRLRGQLIEGQTRFETLLALSAPGVADHDRGLVLSTYQGVCFELSQYQRLESIADEGIALWTALKNPLELGLALCWKGHAHNARRDSQAALAFYETALPRFRSAENASRIAETLCNMGNALVDLNRPAQAVEVMTEALLHYRAAADPWGSAFCHEVLGLAQFMLADFDACAGHWREARDRFDSSGHILRSVSARLNLAALALRKAEEAQARDALREAIEHLGTHLFRNDIAAALSLAAQYSAAFADPVDAVVLAAANDRWTHEWNVHHEVSTLFGAQDADQLARSKLPPAALAQATQHGRSLSVTEALARAKMVVTSGS